MIILRLVDVMRPGIRLVPLPDPLAIGLDQQSTAVSSVLISRCASSQKAILYSSLGSWHLVKQLLEVIDDASMDLYLPEDCGGHHAWDNILLAARMTAASYHW